jgi:hypothetical protein
MMLITTVSRKSMLLSARFHAETIIGVELLKEVFPLERGECPYVVEINASAKMFYFSKHL